jgi:hypothetical protein
LTPSGDLRPDRGPGPGQTLESGPAPIVGGPATETETSTGPVRDRAVLGPILARLGGEIRRPLQKLRGGIDRLLDDPSRPITEAERVQARTMLGLCDDLDRLTRECMEGPGTSPDA